MPITRPLTRSLTRSLTRALTDAGGGGGGGPVISNIVDVFLVAGQSNVVGNGDSATSTPAPYGLRVVGGVISALADPLVMANSSVANTGSAWPAFAAEWTARTGNRCAIVPYGINSSGLINASTWSPTGGWRGFAATELQNAINAINAHPTYDVGQVNVIWNQGETDSAIYNGTTFTPTVYKDALKVLAAFWKSTVAAINQVYVVNISATGGTGGTIANMSTLSENYQATRIAQSLACDESADLTSAYNGMYHILAAGLSKDGTHYLQPAYNLMGRMAAKGILVPQTVPATTPFIASTNYVDPLTTFRSTRTAPHTTSANTDCLVIGLSMQFHDNSGAIGMPAMTFGGVPMRLVAFTNVFAASPASGSVATAVFYLPAAVYGSSLSSVTQSVVLTIPGAPRTMDWVCFDTTGLEVAEADAGAFPTPATGSGTVTANISTLWPSVIITAASSIASAAAPMSGTLTGSTEVLDSSTNVSGTRTGTSLIGYSVEASAVTAKAITATWSANCTHMTMACIALRAKIPGE